MWTRTTCAAALLAVLSGCPHDDTPVFPKLPCEQAIAARPELATNGQFDGSTMASPATKRWFSYLDSCTADCKAGDAGSCEEYTLLLADYRHIDEDLTAVHASCDAGHARSCDWLTRYDLWVAEYKRSLYHYDPAKTYSLDDFDGIVRDLEQAELQETGEVGDVDDDDQTVDLVDGEATVRLSNGNGIHYTVICATPAPGTLTGQFASDYADQKHVTYKYFDKVGVQYGLSMIATRYTMSGRPVAPTVQLTGANGATRARCITIEHSGDR